MKAIELDDLQKWYKLNFEKNLFGRRILFSDIEPLIHKLPAIFKKEIIGYSESGIPIYKILVGKGKTKVLLWSQMHGNESTGTKAMFDLFNYIDNNSNGKTILDNCTLCFIPLLNPDGAIKFTRENLKGIDLNRDAVDRKAVESTILRSVLDDFNPKFCFNLHDQRAIFNVEGFSNPATISFLAPSEEIERRITNGRKETMSVIVAMNDFLQQIIPNQIGRYTDEFYPTATGDNFQKLGYNTILIEAGHYKNDYDREDSRKFNFYALVKGVEFIASINSYDEYKTYFEIPNNDKLFLDIIYKNIRVIENGKSTITDIGIQHKFKIINDKLEMYKCIEKKGNLSKYHTYKLIDGTNLDFNELKLSNS